ncbi:hypothetical protein BDK51DRAFT_38247 [Blyttiomyces helicus]|uniref:Uncharacterized protein n=1 Tax=Blyttiomyces helicus TaxID=388810 RepID=A0A4P9WM28_9FUNG|nr:hypothetical protein BDK51DRAFT_38247 [Blyttiomyces helicus]|eukprot:RKO94121.1 hypothetical protein BDK51DRAFT_38247 [Blyttiomyces helicus]
MAWKNNAAQAQAAQNLQLAQAQAVKGNPHLPAQANQRHLRPPDAYRYLNSSPYLSPITFSLRNQAKKEKAATPAPAPAKQAAAPTKQTAPAPAQLKQAAAPSPAPAKQAAGPAPVQSKQAVAPTNQAAPQPQENVAAQAPNQAPAKQPSASQLQQQQKPAQVSLSPLRSRCTYQSPLILRPSYTDTPVPPLHPAAGAEAGGLPAAEANLAKQAAPRQASASQLQKKQPLPSRPRPPSSTPTQSSRGRRVHLLRSSSRQGS